MHPSSPSFDPMQASSCFGTNPCDEPGPPCDRWLAGQSTEEPWHVCPHVLRATVAQFARQRALLYGLPGMAPETMQTMQRLLSTYPLPAGPLAIHWWLADNLPQSYTQPPLLHPLLTRPESARIALAVRRRTEKAECWFLGLAINTAARLLVIQYRRLCNDPPNRAAFERVLARLRQTTAHSANTEDLEVTHDALHFWEETANMSFHRIWWGPEGLYSPEYNLLPNHSFARAVWLYEGEHDPDLLTQIAKLEHWYNLTVLGKVLRPGRPVGTGTFRTRAQFLETVRMALQEVRQAGLSETEERLCEFLAYYVETRGTDLDARQLRRWMAQFNIKDYPTLLKAADTPDL